MKECRRCGKEIVSEQDDVKICKECHSMIFEDFKQDIQYSKQNSKQTTFKLRPGWEVKCYNTVSRLEESCDFLHLDIRHQGLQFEISIRKHDDGDDFFRVWIADKQLLIKTNDGNFKKGDNYDGHGKVIMEVPYKQVDVDIPKEHLSDS